MADPIDEAIDTLMPDGPAPSGTEDSQDAETAAAQDAMDAVSAGDPVAFKAAFKRMYDICSNSKGEADEYEG